MKNKKLNEQIERIKTLFTEERMFGNLCEQNNFTWDSDTESDTVVSTEPQGTSYVEPSSKQKSGSWLSYLNKNLGKNKKGEIKKEEPKKDDSDEIVNLTDDMILDIVESMISNYGNSKSYYDDPMGLGKDKIGKTFVGILHFTGGGLDDLYDFMDTQKYFGKSKDEMKNSNITNSPYELDDTEKKYENEDGKKITWEEGIRNFLNSSESESVQNKAVLKRFKKHLKKYVPEGDYSERDYAIFISLDNTSSATLLNLGRKNNWDAEKMMNDYCSGNCRSRCRNLNDYYPIADVDNKEFFYDGCA